MVALPNLATAPAARAPPHTPHRPEGTVLYRVVTDHLDSFVDYARQHYEKPLPWYVQRELRRYLSCGIFSEGFVRCHCDGCGRDLLVAFSCKNRGICPSCSARRMCNSAAHITDRVVPDVPALQWVLSLPFELRRLAAFRADVLRAIARIFYEAVATHYTRTCAVQGAQGGAVTLIQRFGGSINLNPHLHVAALDGVFSFEDGLRFHPAPAPRHEELCVVVKRVHDRVVKWLRHRGLIDERDAQDRSTEPPEQTPIDACADVAMRGGTFAAITDSDDDGEGGERALARLASRCSAAHGGFDVHAGVRIAEGDYEGRERLLRYGLRPCFALQRLSLLPDGRVAYRVKAPRSRRTTHRIMDPIELIARLCALVPPPRFPLVRYHGLFAPNSPRRRDVIPRPPAALAKCPIERHGGHPARSATETAGAAPRLPGMNTTSKPCVSAKPDLGLPLLAPQALEDPAGPDVERIAPNVISVRRWSKLLDGKLLATSPRLDWATLLRRTYDVDVFECAKCGGRLRVVEVVSDKQEAAEAWSEIEAGDQPEPRARAPSRAPPGQLELPWTES
jgi:hypothetical protein